MTEESIGHGGWQTLCVCCDKHEWLEDIKREESLLASFLACTEDSKRGGRLFEEGLKLNFICTKRFRKEHLRGICMGLVIQQLHSCILNLASKQLFLQECTNPSHHAVHHAHTCMSKV